MHGDVFLNGGVKFGTLRNTPRRRRPVVISPKSNRIEPWEYDKVMYRRLNKIERLFRRLKGFRRIFSRFEKLDVMFIGFIHFALIDKGLKLC